MPIDFKPRAYQGPAIVHLLDNPYCALWSGCGTGKSAIALTALDALYMSGLETAPTLILGPLRVARSVWSEEVTKWNHLSGMEVQTIIGTEKERLAALTNSNASVFTLNYENIQWLTEQYADRPWPFKLVIADESPKLKSFRLRQGGKRAHALSAMRKHVRRWVNLSGTPIANGYLDLWGQTWFLDRGQRLGRTFTAYKSRWFYQRPGADRNSPVFLQPHAEKEIQARLKDITLVIDPKDHFDLKEPIVNNIFVDLPQKAKALYKDMEKRMFLELEDSNIEAFNAASKTVKCLQLANGAIYKQDDSNSNSKDWFEVHNAKMEALESIIEESAGANLIVAYQFKSDLARLLKRFPQGRHLDTKKDEDDFKAGKIPLLFTHPASAGHGIDGFQNICNQIAFFGIGWNLEEYIQIIERIGPVRQAQSGFKRNVFVHHILAKNTLDEVVLERQQSKATVQELLKQAMKRRK